MEMAVSTFRAAPRWCPYSIIMSILGKIGIFDEHLRGLSMFEGAHESRRCLCCSRHESLSAYGQDWKKGEALDGATERHQMQTTSRAAKHQRRSPESSARPP